MYGNKTQYDYAFKFIMIGDTGVGKTSLISRFISGKFNFDHEFTIGVQFGSKTISVNNKMIKLQIWDTAGQQQFKAVTRSYYRSSAAALVVFDITRRQTFRNASRWIEDVRNNSNKDVVMVLVGNKSDLIQQRKVTRNQALGLANNFQMLYLETSAYTQENVERAFVWPSSSILDKIEVGSIVVNKENPSIQINSSTRDNEERQREPCEC